MCVYCKMYWKMSITLLCNVQNTQYISVDHINTHSFNQLMSSKDKYVLCNLSKFVYYAFLLREKQLCLINM